jgi:glycosyltransferase involved in cell wall biosynthesis
MVVKSILENIIDTENKYIFYVFDKSNPLEILNIKPQVDFEIVETKTLKTVIKKPLDFISTFQLVFHRFERLKPYRPDIFIQFDFMLGLPAWRSTKTYTIAYDLIPLIMKKEYLPSPLFAWSNRIGRKRSKLKAAIRATYYLVKNSFYYKNFRRSDHIISISDATSKSFTDILGIPPRNITTIPLAPVQSSDSLDKSILKQIPKPYVFYIGGTDSRKRVEQIIYAFNIVRGRGHDLQLVLAGNEFVSHKKIPSEIVRNAIQASPYNDDILCLGFVSDTQKNALYNQAHAFVFCSLYEGFGLPVVEAAVNNCPVVAYDNSSIPEAAGGAALLVESNDYVGIAEKIIELYDKNLRDTCIELGRKQAEKFSWDKFIAKFLKTITK